MMHLALIGCGGFGMNYVREAVERTDLALVAVCDPNPDARAKAAQTVGAKAYESVDAALDHPDLDAVIVATPNYLHAEIACAAASRGLHVLSEKPMATNLADAERMIAVCREAGVRLMIGLSSRYTAAFREAYALVSSGQLGEPLMITNRYHYALAPAAPGRTWHNDPARMGGGALIQMGIHSIDRVGWFAGAVPEAVCARVAKGGARWSDNLALCQVTYRNGVLGSIEVAGVASANLNTMTVHLTQGEIIIERSAVRWYDGAWHETQHPGNALARELDDLVAAIEYDREPVCSGVVALAAHQVCFGAYRSAKEGRVVEIHDGELG